jgi:hypothetical protein
LDTLRELTPEVGVAFDGVTFQRSSMTNELIAVARTAGLCVMHGEVLGTRHRILRFGTRLRFGVKPDRADARLAAMQLSLVPGDVRTDCT